MDDGALYSAIGIIELLLLLELLGHQKDVILDPIPSTLQGHTNCKYGVGDHFSVPRPIIGSIEIPGVSDSGIPASILKLDVSSQFLINKNFTRD